MPAQPPDLTETLTPIAFFSALDIISLILAAALSLNLIIGLMLSLTPILQEAPVLLAYSARNRSASCRIPITLSKKAARCEIRFGDAAGNPYLTFAAMLMAGLDGIKNKIDPGKSFDKDLYALSEDEVKKIPTVCGSLREAMESLDKDRDFLKQGNVFTDDQIDAYIALKFEEIHNFEHTPHPIEFEMYYSC